MFGAAVAAMHFTGMAAMQAPADFAWDYTYVAASIAIGAACGALGLWLFARSPTAPWHLAGTLGLTVAIAGLHFTAMSALTLSPNPLAAPTMTLVMAPNWLAFAIAAAMVLVVALGLSGSAFDRLLVQRATLEAARLRMYVDELEMTKGELQRSNKNLEIALTAAAAGSQAKSQFLATMSHELRTPLNAIIGFSEIIDNESLGPLGNSRYGDYVKDILSSGRHLLKLVNEVLDFSKVDSGRLELGDDIVDIGDLIRGTVRMIRTQADQAEVKLRSNIAVDLPLLRADERRLRQVLINLLSNAVKFTQPGGDVTISANVGVDGITFCIDDTGIGMAPEQIPIALERFGQVTSDLARRYDGAGLGLPLAKKLTELHGGTLTIESALEVGTRITVTLPWTRAVLDPALEERTALTA
jgi:signal transduction histidine kinase